MKRITEIPPMKGTRHYSEISGYFSEQFTRVIVNGKLSNKKLGFIGQFGSFNVPAEIGVLWIAALPGGYLGT